MSALRLSVAQTPAELDTTDARLDWLRERLPQVTSEQADLLLLPELFACGYNIGSVVAARAEALDGPTCAAISELARDFGIAICYGFAERSGDDLYNAAVTLSERGEVLSHQRKLAIPPGYEKDCFTAGQGCSFFAFRGFKIATLICYDAEFPETVRHVAGMGVDLVLVPTALSVGWAWVAHKMIPTRAYENGVFLAYANSAGTENGMTYLGASVIAAPDGEEIARAGDAPQIIYGDLEKNRVTVAQARLPYLQDRHGLKLAPQGG